LASREKEERTAHKKPAHLSSFPRDKSMCAVSEEGKVCAAGDERKQLYLFLKCDNQRASVIEFTQKDGINGA
jgi:hypothetical protein